jgi:hypothetical protein
MRVLPVALPAGRGGLSVVFRAVMGTVSVARVGGSRHWEDTARSK